MDVNVIIFFELYEFFPPFTSISQTPPVSMIILSVGEKGYSVYSITPVEVRQTTFEFDYK
jgi:hypothetical protein